MLSRRRDRPRRGPRAPRRRRIKAWHREANAKYRYVIEPLDASVNGPAVDVRARVAGDFPGSPIITRLHFTLAGEGIESLEITA